MSTAPSKHHIKRLAEEARQEISGQITDFLGRYHAAFHLHQIAETRPDLLEEESLAALEHLLIRFDGYKQRQRYFLFRETAQALAEIVQQHPDAALADRAARILKSALAQATGPAHRAAAEALGGLPAPLPKTHCPPRPRLKIVPYQWARLLQQLDLPPNTAFQIKGRSLITPFPSEPSQGLLVMKMTRQDADHTGLFKEAQWIQRASRTDALKSALGDNSLLSPVLPGNLPNLVRIHGLPKALTRQLAVTEPATALCFRAPPDYYRYPNAPESVQQTQPPQWTRWLTRAAKRLARLLGQGLFHDAPIPLFHNRTQGHRRDDSGMYQWYRSGRLDQWLTSCDYPNFSLKGLRDLEHLTPLTGGGLKLYRAMGTHLLSLLLVCGSCFRNQAPQQKGLDAQGRPLDLRHLFDHKHLSSMVQAVCEAYYVGFVGVACCDPWPLNFDHLAGRMIDEMGVDRHMTEILRLRDQAVMDRAMFEAFLRSRGYGEEKIRITPKDSADLTLFNGPHLGDFNRTISLPELIEAVGAIAGICVADRYRRNSTGQTAHQSDSRSIN